MRRLWHPRGLRTRLLVAVVVGFGVALAAMTIGFNLILRHSLSSDATRVAQERAVSRLATITASQGRLTAPDTPDDQAIDSLVWVFEGKRAIESPPAVPALQRAVERLAGGPAQVSNALGGSTRLASQPVVIEGKRVGTVVTALALRPYERTERTALLASLVLAGILFASICVAAGWTLRAALRPVARMTADAAAWSERDLDRRFNLGEPYDELTRLAQTLDGLLDRLAASLRHERRFSAEVSHELRTPLAKISAEAELALRRERDPSSYRDSLAAVLRYARQLTRIIDTLLAAARQEAAGSGGISDAGAAARRAAESCEGLAAARNLSIGIQEPPGALPVGVDEGVLERILQPLLENACRYGRTRAGLAVVRAGSQVLVTVTDDGPGVAADELERIFDPGVRGSAANGHAGESGAGLGLALSRRLARAAGGEVAAESSAGGGRFTVRLPGA